MSHFARIVTKLRDLETIERALPELGYAIRPNTRVVRGYGSQTEEAELVIDTHTDYDIGGVKNAEGCYEFVCDWGMARIDQQGFVGRLSQRYSAHRVRALAKKQGFAVVEQPVDEAGNVRLVLRKFV